MKKAVKLIEYIHPSMDLLFVALNAPEVSNANAHWFSYNLSFWNLLYRSGIITSQISNPLLGDEMIFGRNQFNFKKWNIGVTDLNREIVSTPSRQVNTDKGQVLRIIQILENTSTKRLCLMHSRVAEEFELNGLIKRNYVNGQNQFGVVGKYKKTVIYEVPFHSGNSISLKEQYYSKIIS